MIFPNILEKGDIIGVTATSSGAEREIDILKIDKAIKNINNLGYKVLETENVRKFDKLVSSSGKERAKEFFELYKNQDVKQIIAMSGGEFLMEMLPFLEKFDLGDITPKWVQGFSDTSLLLYYITTKYNIATIHGSNFKGYGRKEICPSYKKSLEAISTKEDLYQESFKMYESTPIYWKKGKEFELPNLDTKVKYKNLYEQNRIVMEGRLIGGCMDVLKLLLGTPYDYTKKFCSQFNTGMIWYLENCEMNVCEMYRTLWQMKEAGWFKNAKGFIIGRTRSKETIQNFTYEDALHGIFDDLGVPVIYDIDVGHVELQWTMINGSLAKFEYENSKGSILQKMI